MKKFRSILIVAFVLLAVAGAAYALDTSNADYSVDVYVYGQQIEFPDQKPFIDTSVNRTYVPVRFVSEALGASVDWDGEKQIVTISQEELTVNLTIDSNQAIAISGEETKTFTLDAPAALVNDRTMVPLRFVSEVLGAQVDWTPGAPGVNGRVDISPEFTVVAPQ